MVRRRKNETSEELLWHRQFHSIKIDLVIDWDEGTVEVPGLMHAWGLNASTARLPVELPRQGRVHLRHAGYVSTAFRVARDDGRLDIQIDFMDGEPFEVDVAGAELL